MAKISFTEENDIFKILCPKCGNKLKFELDRNNIQELEGEVQEELECYKCKNWITLNVAYYHLLCYDSVSVLEHDATKELIGTK